MAGILVMRERTAEGLLRTLPSCGIRIRFAEGQKGKAWKTISPLMTVLRLWRRFVSFINCSGGFCGGTRGGCGIRGDCGIGGVRDR